MDGTWRQGNSGDYRYMVRDNGPWCDGGGVIYSDAKSRFVAVIADVCDKEFPTLGEAKSHVEAHWAERGYRLLKMTVPGAVVPAPVAPAKLAASASVLLEIRVLLDDGTGEKGNLGDRSVRILTQRLVNTRTPFSTKYRDNRCVFTVPANFNRDFLMMVAHDPLEDA